MDPNFRGRSYTRLEEFQKPLDTSTQSIITQLGSKTSMECSMPSDKHILRSVKWYTYCKHGIYKPSRTLIENGWMVIPCSFRSPSRGSPGQALVAASGLKDSENHQSWKLPAGWYLDVIQGDAPQLANLVYNSNIQALSRVRIYLQVMRIMNQLITGEHHLQLESYSPKKIW